MIIFLFLVKYSALPSSHAEFEEKNIFEDDLLPKSLFCSSLYFLKIEKLKLETLKNCAFSVD